MTTTLDAHGELASAPQLKGRPLPWSRGALAFLAVCVTLGLWLRIQGLAQEGFSDDELHKWLAANRYLLGDFGGDDLEHPMLMKSLIALTLLVGRQLQWAPETITRLPNAVGGGIAVIVLALLGRRLFGRVAGLFAAAVGSVSVSWIGYQRIAKEDALLGLFLLVLCLCLAEAKAAADGGEDARSRRFELGAAAALSAMLAAKYYLQLAFIPIVAVLWIGRTQTVYRVRPRRWAQLILTSFAIWVCLNWMIVLPSTVKYILDYVAGAKHGGRATHLTMLFMGRLYRNVFHAGWDRMPVSFFPVFAAVKQTPVVFLFSLVGLAWAIWKRHPSQRLVLAWMAVWFVGHSISGAKYARMFVPIFPSFFLLASSAAALFVERARASRFAFASRPVAALLAALLIGPELGASISHAPHFRTYVSPLGGGDRLVTWYFPHDDYFDAGFREAIEYVAAHAEPGAEVSSEIDWTARYYAQRFGREDLFFSMIRPKEACRGGGRTCYVAVQEGRLYEANQKAVQQLAMRKPWHVVQIRGVDVVRVYRLAPGDSPFPNSGASSSR
jgi:hypothetical protein